MGSKGSAGFVTRFPSTVMASQRGVENEGGMNDLSSILRRTRWR